MNTPSNSVAFESQTGPSAKLSSPRPFYWSLRRELWENRSIYIAPLAAAAIFLFAFIISTIHLADKMRGALAMDAMKQHEVIAQPYDYAALLIMGAAFIVGIFYSLDALHGERRDRSILFWKSLPVSDLTTVLVKASIPMVVLPLLSWVITVATHLFMLLLSTAVLLGSGVGVGALWSQVAIVQMSMLLLYHLVTVHMLYYAPIYAWLLLVSGWARRAVFLWAGLPLLAIGVIEKIAFNTSYFVTMLESRLNGGAESVAGPSGLPMDQMTQITLGRFLSGPGLWIGLLLTAGFLALASRSRRYREPI